MSPIESSGTWVVDHVGRVGGVLHPECYSEIGIRSNVRVDRTRWTLRGQDEMHTKASASLRNSDERLDEVGEVGPHRCELIDDDHESRE